MLPTNHPYLRPAELERLRHLVFATRSRADGHFAGRHASPQHGRSIEFRDYQPYQPGDSAAQIDWKVLARTGRPYVRRSEHQTDLTVQLLVDASASMAYRGVHAVDGGWWWRWLHQHRNPGSQQSSNISAADELDELANRPTKYDHACRIAAAIAMVTLRQQDRVGFAVARDGLMELLPARSSSEQLAEMLDVMLAQPLIGDAAIDVTLEELLPMLPRHASLVLLSDMWQQSESAWRMLAGWRARGGSVAIFHVLHEDEIDLPDTGLATFIDSETDESVVLDPELTRQRYKALITAQLDQLRDRCHRLGFDYQLARMGVDPVTSLQSFLLSRSALA